MQRFVPLARELGEGEDEVSLVAMLLDDYYQETLHAPQIPPAPPSKKAAGSGQKSSGSGKPRRKRRSGKSKRG
jgi:ATP-dependent RNA helicase DeaD